MRKLGVAMIVVLTGLALIWWLTPREVQLARWGLRLTATLEREWPDTTNPAREAAFSPDGALLATSNASGQVVIRQTSDWRAVRSLGILGGATSVAFPPDGKLLFTAGYDGVVRGWRISDGRLVQQFKGATATIWTLDVHRDGG